jgi:hypothetical protein
LHWSETKRSEAKRSETKNIWEWNKRKYALLILLWSEAKNSKRNEAKRREFFFTWACETDAKRISFRFVSLWSEKFFLRNRRTLVPCIHTVSLCVYSLLRPAHTDSFRRFSE